MWFNPAVRRTRLRRDRRGAGDRRDRSSPASDADAPAGARALRTSSSETGAHRPPLRRATSSTSSAAAWPPSTATTTGAASCTSPAAARRPRCTATRARPAGRLRFTPLRVAGHRPDRGHRRLPARHRQRRPHRSRRAARRRGRHPARARRLPLRARQRGARRRRRRHVDRRLQRDVGGRQRAAHAGVRRLPRAPTARRARTAGCCGPPPTATRYAPAIALVTRLLHVVDAVQRLEPVGPARPADDQRPALLPRRDGSAVARRARRGAAAVHRGRRLAPAADLGDGHRQRRTSPATAIPRCT